MNVHAAINPNLPDIEFKITKKIAREVFGETAEIVEAVTQDFVNAFPTFGLNFVLVNAGQSAFTLRCQRSFQIQLWVQWVLLVELIQGSSTFSFSKPQKLMLLTNLLFRSELLTYKSRGIDFFNNPLNPESCNILKDFTLFEDGDGDVTTEQQVYEWYVTNKIEIDERCPVEDDEELLVNRLAIFNVVKLIQIMF